MKNITDHDLFWKIVIGNKGKTILIDLPKRWGKLSIDENCAVRSKVGRTLQDVGVNESQLNSFDQSNNLKLAITDVFEKSSIKRVFVINNNELNNNK